MANLELWIFAIYMPPGLGEFLESFGTDLVPGFALTTAGRAAQ